MKHHHSHDVITDDPEIIDEPTVPDEPEIIDEPTVAVEPTVTNEPIIPDEQPITTGYIYCFETESMPGTYKIGMTTRDVDVRLKEANQSNTWKPPIPYQVVFSKYVQNPREKEGMIHTLLSEYRIHPDREFFKLELEKLRCLFGLITEIKE